MVKLLDTTTSVVELWAWTQKVKDSGEWSYEMGRIFRPYCIFKFNCPLYDFGALYVPGDYFDIYCGDIEDRKTKKEVGSIFMQLINES